MKKYGRNILAAVLIYFTIYCLIMLPQALVLYIFDFPKMDSIIVLIHFFISVVFGSTLYYGLQIFSFRMLRGENPGYGEVFIGFKNFKRIISMTLWLFLWYYLWSLLLCVFLSIPLITFIMSFIFLYGPGISQIIQFIALGISVVFIVVGIYIVFLRYSQIYYILYDNPEMPVRQVMRCSIELMKENKKQFFFLILSKLWWLLLIFIGITAVSIIEAYKNQSDVHIGIHIAQMAVSFLLTLYSCFISPTFYQALITSAKLSAADGAETAALEGDITGSTGDGGKAESESGE
ncbi:MAG: DUF975 family protein [Spirochaetaceae bacterium]|nr:DUF975 family protein [Spirochaetaceae bacterium]